MHRAKVWSAAALPAGAVCCALLACRAPTAATLDVCPGDTVTVSITQTSSGPEISWTPRCAMAALSVVGSAALWTPIADSNVILPPVRYGQWPTGTTAGATPPPLSQGVAYDIWVWRWFGGTVYFRAGGQSFMPQPVWRARS